jgi:hypothetical protein
MQKYYLGLISLCSALTALPAQAFFFDTLKNSESVSAFNDALSKAKDAPYRVSIGIKAVEVRFLSLELKTGATAFSRASQIVADSALHLTRTPVLGVYPVGLVPMNKKEEWIFIRDEGPESFTLFQFSDRLSAPIRRCLSLGASQVFPLLKELRVPKEALSLVSIHVLEYRDSWWTPLNMSARLETRDPTQMPELQIEVVMHRDQTCHLPSLKPLEERLRNLQAPIPSEDLLEEITSPAAH